jgi:methyl acetate hydrolase
MLGNRVTERAWMYPLNAQPGVEWHYGVGIDWAGILITRITGMNLQAYFEREIFHPLGLRGLSFYPTEEIKEKMMRLTFGDEEGIRGCFPDNFTHQPFKREGDPAKVGPLLSGGAGLFGTARDYLALLRAILQSHPDHAHPRPLLTPSAYRMLFTDCLDPRTDKRPMVQMMISGTFHGANLTADPEGGSVGHSVGLLLNFEDSDHGRRAGSGSWDGAAKTQFWIDPKTGIAVSARVFIPRIGYRADSFMRLLARIGSFRQSVSPTVSLPILTRFTKCSTS